MDCRAANFDSDRRVEDADGSLEGLESEVLVGEDAVFAIVDAERDADCDAVFVRAEPGVALGLMRRWRGRASGIERGYRLGEG